MKFLFATIVSHKSVLVALTLACIGSQAPVIAQSLEAMSDKEIVRRQENLLVGEKLISAGDKAVAEKDYETAYTNYLAGDLETQQLLPDERADEQARVLPARILRACVERDPCRRRNKRAARKNRFEIQQDRASLRGKIDC